MSENNLTEDQKRNLTEWLGETYHSYKINQPVIYGDSGGVSTCSCGLRGFPVRDICAKSNRTFTTWPDLGALIEKLTSKGLWLAFDIFLFEEYLPKHETATDMIKELLMQWFLSDVKKAIQLVAEFKPWERK